MLPPVATTATDTAVAKPPPGNRRYDITVFGCTGNAGRGVAYHVLRHAARAPSTPSTPTPTPIRVGLAGRNRDKIEQILHGLRTELKGEPNTNGGGVSASIDDVDISIIVADASDPASMLAMAESSRVVVSCAGPFGRYGEAAVVACIEGKAHYLDITGEVPWVSRMISDHNAAAEEAGVALLPFSGYDCVPAELGMLLAGSTLEEYGGTDAAMDQLNISFRSTGGGFPRGTLETLLDGFEGKTPQRKEGDVRFYPKEYRHVANAALSPIGFLLPKWSDQLGTYTGPNFMTAVNTPVLCRAAPALGFSADNLVITDRSVISGRPSAFNGWGLFPTQLYIGTLIMGGIAMILPPFRWWLRNRLKSYSFKGDTTGKVYVDAQAISNTGASKGASSSVSCVYPGDAGIYATGLFATAVANALLEATTDGSKLPPPLAGFHSPVSSLHRSGGGLLVKYLRKLGATIEINITPPDGTAVKVVDATKLRSRL